MSSTSLFPRRGYILLIAGILIGFLIFSGISLIFTSIGRQPSTTLKPESIEFEFLYTSEKQGWIERVTPDFERWFEEEFDIHLKIELTVTGTHKTVNLILLESTKPTAWSPASSIWIPYLNNKWIHEGHEEEIAKDWTPLATSPIVIAGWESFLSKNNISSFQDLFELSNRGVDYKYGHPDPILSNGGAMVVILEFAEALNKKPEDITIEDLKDPRVIDYVKTIESRSVAYGESTGFFGSWAAENGPEAIDAFGVYENIVIDNSLKAEKKWEDSIVAVYPEGGTLLSDHPYVILDAEWISIWQRFAASQYLLYLLKPEVQELAQEHGLRPVNPSVPLDEILFSPENGVHYKIPVPILKPPSGEVLEAIFVEWVKARKSGT
jgi:Ca-activated chloride channel family protein